MRAIDTNVLVRFLTDDDPDQSPRARDIIAAGDVFISTTVIVETEWVLRRGYQLRRTQLGRTLRQVAGLPTIILEEPERLALALDLFDQGLELADALHLAGVVDRCETFLTFDRKLIRAAGDKVGIAVQEPPKTA